MYIDPHVHCRDGKEAYKETIAHALSVAERAGATAIFDMPNTKPPVTNRRAALRRLKLAEDAHSAVFYGLYMALTSEPDQIEGAVRAYRELPQIVGFKLYAGHSVGNIGVVDKEQQRRIYDTLKRLGYDGVLAVHCEKEGMIKKRWDKTEGKMVQDWDPRKPVTHAYARPPEAEVASVRDQIELSIDTGFSGILHIAHISVPEAVEYVSLARAAMRITCGATPHHLLFDLGRMEEHNGVLYKMNPPLRPKTMVDRLLAQLREGKIDWVETDHAPHSQEEKRSAPYMSGIPWLHAYPRFISWLRRNGFSEEQIRDLTFNNINRAFGLDLKPREAALGTDLSAEYFMDPLKGTEN